MRSFFKKSSTRRVTAALLSLAIVLSVFTTFWASALIADRTPANGDDITALYDSGTFNEGGKTVEVLHAYSTTGPYVYCIKAASSLPVARGGKLTNTLLENSTVAQKAMGKVKSVIEIPNSVLEGCTDWETWYDAGGTEGYIVRQLLIWNELYKMRNELGSLYCTSDNSAIFKGWDLSSLTSSGYPLVRVAKQIATSFDEPEAYLPTPLTYAAIVQNKSTVQLDTTTGKYYATFEVIVKEKNLGSLGGVFKFKSISGASVYAYNSSTGRYDTAVNTSNTYTVGGTALKFRIEGTYASVVNLNNGGKGFKFDVEAIASTGNSNQTKINYGLFQDSQDPLNQTFVAPYVESQKYYEPAGGEFPVGTGAYELTKNLKHPDGSKDVESGLRFRLYSASYSDYASAQAAGVGFEGTTNASGKITFNNVPFGQYKLVQVDVPAGTKAMDPNPVTVTVTAGITTYGTFDNEEIAGYLQIQKRYQTTEQKNAGVTYANLPAESGAVFQVYNKKYASYDAAPTYMRDTLTTGSNGKTAVSKALPIGTYVIHQTTASSVALVGSDTEVTITAAHTASAPNVSNLTNQAYEVHLQLRKVDENGAVIPASDVEFEVFKADKTSLVKAVDGTSTFKTDANGECTLTNVNLPVGTYYVHELSAPAGYIQSDELLQFSVAKGDKLITVGTNSFKRLDFANKPVTIELELAKNGEQLSGANEIDTGYNGLMGQEFTYSAIPLEGAVYELYCDSDVLDASGNYRQYNGVELKAGNLLDTLTTDAAGKIDVTGLYLDVVSASATYSMVEIKAPKGYQIDSTPIVFEVTDTRTDKKITLIKSDDIVTDKKQSATIEFAKVARDYEYDAEAKDYVAVDSPLPGAVFGIYAVTDILAADGTVAVEAGALIEVVTSDADGKCSTTADYPLGYDYMIKELEAPEGYVLVDDEYTVSVKATEDDNTSTHYTFKLDEPIVNELSRACIKVNKLAADTKAPMQNVTFEVWSSDGKTLLETVVTDAEGKATTKTAIPYGETVLLRETKTDEFYELAADSTIKINVMQDGLDDYGVQDFTVLNYRKAEIAVYKVAGDGQKTVMDGVTYELWKKGTSTTADELIAKEVTDAKGEIHFFVPVGDYYVKEVSVGKWTQFTINAEPINVSATEHGKAYKFNVTDDYTKSIVEKNDASDGKTLANCGISVRNSANITLSFVWNADLGGYVYCDPNTEGAVTVLYTNDAEGRVIILGLEAGNYEIFEVVAPDGYRNDSAVLGVKIDEKSKGLEVMHLYDTLKTAERDTIIGTAICAILGISAIACMSLAIVDIVAIRKQRRRNN